MCKNDTFPQFQSFNPLWLIFLNDFPPLDTRVGDTMRNQLQARVEFALWMQLAPDISWWICSFVNCVHASGCVFKQDPGWLVYSCVHHTQESGFQLWLAVSQFKYTDGQIKALSDLFASFVCAYVPLGSVKRGLSVWHSVTYCVRFWRERHREWEGF